MLATITGTGDGTAPVVTVTFPFIDKSHVIAAVDGVPVAATWTGAAQITFTGAVPAGSSWAVYRKTPTSPALVDFTDGSVLTEADLDLAETSHLYRDEELTDLITSTNADLDAETATRVANAAAESAARVAAESALQSDITSEATTRETADDAESAARLALQGRAMRAPGSETLPEMPSVAERAAKYAAYGVSGEPIAVDSTVGGADATLRGDLASSSAGSTLILHKLAGAGTFGRSMRQWSTVGGLDAANIFNWIDPAEDADVLAGISVTDHSAAAQAALNLDTKRLWVPKGLFNVSDLQARSGSAIIGGGPGVVTLKALANQDPNVPIIRNATKRPLTLAERDTDISIVGFTLDGNKANNATQIEWGYAIGLWAVDGANIDRVLARNTQGDGLSLIYSSDGVQQALYDIGSSNVSLNMRVEDAERQGVSILAAENVTGKIVSLRSKFFGLDIEPDDAASPIRNFDLSVMSYQDGQGSASAGGIGLASPGGSENINLEFVIYEPNGNGVMWRDAKSLNLRGSVTRPTNSGLFGFDGGAFSSTVHFDVHVEDPGGWGITLKESAGGTYFGAVSVNSAAQQSASIASTQANGELKLHLTNGAQQGIEINGVTGNLVLRDLVVTGHSSHCLWFTGNTSNFKVRGFRSDGSSFGAAVVEAAGSDNNRVTNANISGGYSGPAIQLLGPNSMVDPSATTAITAFAGGGKASATVLRSVFNNVTVVATNGDSVLLPGAKKGDTIRVKNSSPRAMQVFGQGTDTINGVATGTGISQAAGTTTAYFAIADGQWLT